MSDKCPICFRSLGTWIDDPVYATPSLSAVNYQGFTTLKTTHIKELQDNRNLLELDAGLTPTVFSPINDTGKFQDLLKYITELRQSTEQLLVTVGMTKYEYFNYDEDGNYMGTTQQDWTDISIEADKFQFKAMHIEDLRHAIRSLGWIETFNSELLWYCPNHHFHTYNQLLQPGNLCPLDSLVSLQETALSDSKYWLSYGAGYYDIDGTSWAMGSSMLPFAGMFGNHLWANNPEAWVYSYSGVITGEGSVNWSALQASSLYTGNVDLTAVCGGVGSAYGRTTTDIKERFFCTNNYGNLSANASIILQGLFFSHSGVSGYNYGGIYGFDGGQVILLINVLLTANQLIGYDGLGNKIWADYPITAGTIPFATLVGQITNYTTQLNKGWSVVGGVLQHKNGVVIDYQFNHWYSFDDISVKIIDAYNYIYNTAYSTIEPTIIGDFYVYRTFASIIFLDFNSSLQVVVRGINPPIPADPPFYGSAHSDFIIDTIQFK